MSEVNTTNLIKKLDELVSPETITMALNKAAILVENNAKLNCPVSTGELRRSITHEVENNTAIVGTNVEYAPYVEYGTGLFSALGTGRQDVPWSYQRADGEWVSTVGNKPQPFLHPAVQQSRDTILDVFAEAIKRGIKK